jgi:hypothetical protein
MSRLAFFKTKTAQYDVILFTNSLAEICKDNTIPLKFIESVMRHLTTNGIIIIIEPALKHLSRRLMKLRDEILCNKKGSVLLPCLHTSPCPLFSIRAQKEWCHEIRKWQPPEFMKFINRKLHRDIHRLKFSYLVVGKQTCNRTPCNGFLVVSRLLKEKGKQRCFLCTPGARVELVRLNKSISTQNTEFSSIQKGDIISADNINRKRPHYWQIDQHTHINIIYSTLATN